MTSMDDDEFERQEKIRIENEARDSDRWLLNNALAFWSACPNKRCRRARSCVGDAARCHEIFWPVVPLEVKAWWRAIFDAKKTGRSVTQARRAADQALMVQRRRDASLRALEQRTPMVKSDAPAAPPAAPREHAPRVRTI
jgi:hypothetical protein